MTKPVLIIIGAYGSGKSEYAINLAKNLKEQGEDVSLADLDVVNPYFRSRDVREAFKQQGIEVISPEGSYGHADLPMVSPRIAGAIRQKERTVILDVGGDPAGCRALARFITAIEERGYEMQFVVNTSRPFTGTKEDIIKMIDKLQTASKLKITEIIANINLLSETTEELVRDGLEVVQKASAETEIRFEKYLVIEQFKNQISDQILGKKRMVLEYFLKKPWENLEQLGI